MSSTHRGMKFGADNYIVINLRKSSNNDCPEDVQLTDATGQFCTNYEQKRYIVTQVSNNTVFRTLSKLTRGLSSNTSMDWGKSAHGRSAGINKIAATNIALLLVTREQLRDLDIVTRKMMHLGGYWRWKGWILELAYKFLQHGSFSATCQRSWVSRGCSVFTYGSKADSGGTRLWVWF